MMHASKENYWKSNSDLCHASLTLQEDSKGLPVSFTRQQVGTHVLAPAQRDSI